MQIYVFINDTKLQALLDSGSTHNFVDSEAASRAGIVFAALGPLCVAVANGDRVTSSGCCRNLKISIAGEDFIIDCYGLALGSYEMVLGVQ
jgi:predicted aspartyl protease